MIEAAEIARFRYGIDHPLTAQANAITGMFFLRQRESAKAEPWFRDTLASRVKNNRDHDERSMDEFQYGVCLLARREFVEAKARFLAGYNEFRAARGQPPAPGQVSLDWLIEQIDQLRDSKGHLLSESTTLATLHKDPALELIILDLRFPSNPFALP
jgi:hypothetical protein